MKSYFTMLEMLIVTIILLFLTVGIFTVGGEMSKQFKKKQARTDLLKISNAIAAYKGSTDRYPPDYLSSSYNEDASVSEIGSWRWEGNIYKFSNKSWRDIVDQSSLTSENQNILNDFSNISDSNIFLKNILIETFKNSSSKILDEKISETMKLILPEYSHGFIKLSKEFFTQNRFGSIQKLISIIDKNIKYIDALNEYYSIPKGYAKALLSANIKGSNIILIQKYDFGEDIGGEVVGSNGYQCKVKKTIRNIKKFGTDWDLKSSQDELKKIKLIMGSPNHAKKCGLESKVFKCGDLPTDPNYSCGWHNFYSDAWEGGYNSSESSKALYDFLCRPMKGRMIEGKAVSLKYRNAKPFLDMSKSSLKPAGRPRSTDCPGNNSSIHKKYGMGAFDLMDSYKIIDPWGKDYFYVSSAKEYLYDARGGLAKPYINYSKSDYYGHSRFGNVGILYDRVLPYFNKNVYDLASSGPDRLFVNWIKRDYKIQAPSIGYGRIGISNTKYIWGDVNPEGEMVFSKIKPNDFLMGEDKDNDNITNFNNFE